MIPEIDIWRIANLMLKRYAKRRRWKVRCGLAAVMDAIGQLVNVSSRPTALTGAMTLY